MDSWQCAKGYYFSTESGNLVKTADKIKDLSPRRILTHPLGLISSVHFQVICHVIGICAISTHRFGKPCNFIARRNIWGEPKWFLSRTRMHLVGQINDWRLQMIDHRKTTEGRHTLFEWTLWQFWLSWCPQQDETWQNSKNEITT